MNQNRSYMNTHAFGSGAAYRLSGLGDLQTDAMEGAAKAYALATKAAGAAMSLFSTLLPFERAVNGIASGKDACEALKEMEVNALAVASNFIMAHNAGRLTMKEYAAYDQMRHRVYDTQAQFHRAVRKTLEAAMGKALSDRAMARIPWPTWLPALRPETARNQPLPVPSVTPVNGLGAAQFALIGGVIVVVLLALGLVLYFSNDIIEALGSVYLTRAQSIAVQQVLDQRSAALELCHRSGRTAQECTAEVEAAFPMDSINQFIGKDGPGQGKGAMWYLGAFVAVGALGFFAWKMWGEKPRAGTAGLGRATRLRSLHDRSVKSRYMLEV